MVNEAYIYGSEGYIHLPNFLSSKSAYLHRENDISVTFEDERKVHGYLFEAEEAMRCLREGRTESPIMPLDETLSIMKTLDELRMQWGLEY